MLKYIFLGSALISTQVVPGPFSRASFLHFKTFCVVIIFVSLPLACTGLEYPLGIPSTQHSNWHKEGTGQNSVAELNESLSERVCKAGRWRLPPRNHRPSKLGISVP